jgi:hypothetical protein
VTACSKKKKEKKNIGGSSSARVDTKEDHRAARGAGEHGGIQGSDLPEKRAGGGCAESTLGTRHGARDGAPLGGVEARSRSSSRRQWGPVLALLWATGRHELESSGGLGAGPAADGSQRPASGGIQAGRGRDPGLAVDKIRGWRPVGSQGRRRAGAMPTVEVIGGA